MEKFLYHIGNFAILVFIVSLLVFVLIVYLIWHLLKTAIARGVEDGIYNAIVSLKKDGIISDTIYEINRISNLNNLASKENSSNKLNEETRYYEINK